MYEVFVNDRPSCREVERPSFDPADDPSELMHRAFLDLENGLLDEFRITGNVEELWQAFTEQFTVIEAAGGLTFNPRNELLVINRWGKWDLPKGKMEPGESPAQSALREVEEECGITDLALGEPIFPTYHTYRIGEQPILKVAYWFTLRSSGTEKLIPQTEEGIEEVVWMERERWPEIWENTYANISRLLQAQT